QVVWREAQGVAVGLDGSPVILLLVERVAEVEAGRRGEERTQVLAEGAEEGGRFLELAVLVQPVRQVEAAPCVLGPRARRLLEGRERLRVVAVRVLLPPLLGEPPRPQQQLVHHARAAPFRGSGGRRRTLPPSRSRQDENEERDKRGAKGGSAVPSPQAVRAGG